MVSFRKKIALMAKEIPDGGDHIEVMIRLVGLVKKNQANEEDIREIYRLLNSMLDLTDRRVAKLVSTELIERRDLPISVIDKLARDDDMIIATDTIRKAWIIPPKTMMVIARQGDTPRLIALSNRFDLPFNVVETISERRNRDATLCLLCNQDVQFNQAVLNFIFSIWQKDPEFLTVAKIRAAQMGEEAFAKKLENVFLGPEPEMPKGVDRRLWQLVKEGKFYPEQILRSALVGDNEILIELFSIFAVLPVNSVRSLLFEEANGLMMLYRKAGLPFELFDLFKVALIMGQELSGPQLGQKQRDFIYNRLNELVMRLGEIAPNLSVKGPTDLLSHFNNRCTSRMMRYFPKRIDNDFPIE